MSSGKVVPSLPEFRNIQDPAARQFAESVSEILNVRNGDKGSGDHAFLTRADLPDVFGRDNFNLLTAGASDNAVNAGGRRLLVRDAIRDLQRQIAGSPLSIYLAETIGLIKRPQTGVLARIDTINVQFAATNNSVAAVQTQITTLTNSFAATATQVTTVQARLDNATGPGSAVSIEQKFLTLVNADGFLYGQYTVKIDINGFVSGFGLSAIDNGGGPSDPGPSSLFLVRADRFAIGAPGLNAQIPFIVVTGNHTDVNGVNHPNGAVYIEDGMFGQFVADEGNIGDLTVDSLKIKNDAITVPGSADNVPGASIPFGSWLEVCSVTMAFFLADGVTPVTTRLHMQGIVQVLPGGGPYGNTQFDVRLCIDGVPVANGQFGYSFVSAFGGACACIGNVLTSGARTISLQISQGFAAFPYTTGPGNLLALGTKK